ncbi:MAG: DUF3667 domain-containing protein [Vicinamibacterales bacterium]
MHEVAHVDGKILRTAKALLVAPGHLTREYWQGHVASWIRPIRVFLVAAAIHLFFATGIGPINFHVLVERAPNGDRHIMVSSGTNASLHRDGFVAEDAHEQEALLETFAHAYNAVRYLSPLFFACACWVLYRRQQPYPVSHLILALHFYSFWYLLATVAGLLARWQPVLQFLVVGSSLYLALSLRRIFAQAWWLTVAKTVVLTVLLMAIEGGLAYGAIMYAERALGL